MKRSKQTSAKGSSSADHQITRAENATNVVAKYAKKFNRAQVYQDQKKQSKKGYRKHKGQDYSQAA